MQSILKWVALGAGRVRVIAGWVFGARQGTVGRGRDGKDSMVVSEPPAGRRTSGETREQRDTHIDTVLQAAGGAAFAIGITGALAVSTVGMVFAALVGAALGATVPRLLSGHVLFHSKPHRRLG